MSKKARNRSATSPNGVPYLLYKRCLRTLKLPHIKIVTAWTTSSVDGEWKIAEGVYIPKEKESKCLKQFRPISLLNVEGKIYFSCLAARLAEFMTANRYIGTSVQKGGVPGVPGCIEHTTMIWEAIQAQKKTNSAYTARPSQCLRIGASPTSLENAGGSPCS